MVFYIFSLSSHKVRPRGGSSWFPAVPLRTLVQAKGWHTVEKPMEMAGTQSCPFVCRSLLAAFVLPYRAESSPSMKEAVDDMNGHSYVPKHRHIWTPRFQFHVILPCDKYYYYSFGVSSPTIEKRENYSPLGGLRKTDGRMKTALGCHPDLRGC